MMEQLWLSLFLLFNLLIIFHDFCSRRVPNRLILFALAGQAIWLFTALFGYIPNIYAIDSWPQALAGLCIGLIMFYPLWRFRAVGAGDVKFIAVLGFCMGTSGLFPALLIGSALAGAHALALSVPHGRTRIRPAWRIQPSFRRVIPYAAYLAIGALAGLIWRMFNDKPWLYALLDM